MYIVIVYFFDSIRAKGCRMRRLLPDFKQASLVVIGDLMLDRYWQGDTSRISPEAPVPIVHVKQEECRAGGAANVALNAAVLGVTTKLIGFTGVDRESEDLRNILSKVDVDCAFCQDEIRPTITKLRVVSHQQHLLRADFEQSFVHADHQQLVQHIQREIVGHPVIVLSDYAKGTLEKAPMIIEKANSMGAKILVDPKGKDFSKYYGATVLTPNYQEFCTVVGEVDSEEKLIQKGMELIEKLQLQALLITRSERGMTLIDCAQNILHLPAQTKEVFDVTGAGDTVIAVLAASLAAGETLAYSCELANKAAGIVVGKLGTATVSPAELLAHTTEGSRLDRGVVNEGQLLTLRHNARERGEKIVMTNGCFDILHAGHVSYLRAAKKLGDRLIVAVNSDDSVKKLKGPKRPINELSKRMEVLSALESVDWVVSFDDETPQRLIVAAMPDVLVKGGDYKVQDIVGAQEVLAAGGEVRVLQFKQGYSTTQIIETIQAQ